MNKELPYVTIDILGKHMTLEKDRGRGIERHYEVGTFRAGKKDEYCL